MQVLAIDDSRTMRELIAATLAPAGCDVRQERGVAHLLAELKRTLGVAALRAIHANDSLHEHGTRRDQHAHIGSGCIGTAGFRHLMRVSAFRRVPWILETPKDDDGADVRNRKALERLFRATAPPAPGSS